MSKLKSPKIEEWMSKDEKDFRNTAHEYIINLSKYSEEINDYEFLYYFSSGISSLVALCLVNSQKRVFKTSRWHLNVLRKANFLEEWSRVGIRVPSIYSKTEIVDDGFELIRILLMEFIDRKTAFVNLEDKEPSTHTET